MKVKMTKPSVRNKLNGITTNGLFKECKLYIKSSKTCAIPKAISKPQTK